MEDFIGCDHTWLGPYTQARGGRSFCPPGLPPGEAFIEDSAAKTGRAVAERFRRFAGHAFA